MGFLIELDIYSSTQAVNKTQMYCAAASGLPANKVRVSMKRMGGTIVYYTRFIFN